MLEFDLLVFWTRGFDLIFLAQQFTLLFIKLFSIYIFDYFIIFAHKDSLQKHHSKNLKLFLQTYHKNNNFNKLISKKRCDHHERVFYYDFFKYQL